jgi:rhodanese-related sulfurtransferase
VQTSANDVRAALLARDEIALIDVRDEAPFAEAHPLFAACLPLPLIEFEARDRLPRLSTPIVVYDNGDGLARLAVERFHALGYTRVSTLEDGLRGWRASGGEIFRDVNAPSKAFGEIVEARRHTPSIAPEVLKARLDAGDDIVVLDARRFDEYHTMSIPTSSSAPGGELVYRAKVAAPRDETLIVVNCAGRTRSIIGCQSLVNAGLANPTVALRNGTIGWTLAGQPLERGQLRRVAPPPSLAAAADARAAAREVARRTGVAASSWAEVDALRSDPRRTTYCFDVRTPEEFAAGHPRGFRSAPGGQLVQETDVFAPVRGARIVLWDPAGVRAWMTGSWLAQMGWSVHVVEASLRRDVAERGPWRPAVSAAWTEAARRSAANRYRRPYEGTDNPRAAMQAYLDWEYGLVAQLDRDGTHGFEVR